MACSWELIREIQSKTTFPLVSGVTDDRLKRIYPLLQKDVERVCEALDGCDLDLTVFGSALTMRCNAFSDLDLCVKTRQTDVELFHEIRGKISSCCEAPADVLYYNTLEANEPVKEEIDRNGYTLIRGGKRE